jgi:hypothetical protein
MKTKKATTPKTETTTTETTTTETAAAIETAKSKKAAKATKAVKPAKADADGESTDRLPTNLEELKATKGGFVAHLFLTGKDKDAIAKDLAAAFKLGEAQAAKIVRRITGRVRLYSRVFELVPAKKA